MSDARDPTQQQAPRANKKKKEKKPKLSKEERKKAREAAVSHRLWRVWRMCRWPLLVLLPWTHMDKLGQGARGASASASGRSCAMWAVTRQRACCACTVLCCCAN